MQDAVNEMKKMNRESSYLLCLDPKRELALQAIDCTKTLGVGFPHQTRRIIKRSRGEIITMDLRSG